MTWPFGAFIQEARTRGLRNLTPGLRASPEGWVPLTDWRQYSSLQVISGNRAVVELSCNKAELHGTLVGEVEAWADHEVEMRAQVFRMASPGAGTQDSWFAVSTYYWAVFSACLLLRLLGRPVFRLSSEDINVLKALNPSVSGISEGVFKMVQGGVISATTIEVRLHRLKTNYHQSLWAGLFNELDEIQKITASSNSNHLEKSILDEILRVLRSRHGYLSEVRNIVNYRADVGFPANVRGFGFSILPSVAQCENLDATHLLMYLAGANQAVGANGALLRYKQSDGRFLFWVAVALSIFSQALYEEISGASRFDVRWARRRTAFCKSGAGIPDDLRSWLPALRMR